MMITHYFRLARKVLIKNRYYTFINTFGLVVGMLTALVIGKYIGGSLQMDRFHAQGDHIYSISQQETIEGSPEKQSHGTYYGVADLLGQYPEVVARTRYYQHVEALMIAQSESGSQNTFTENTIFVVDRDFLNIFTFPLIHGEKETALSKANSIVLTRSASEKYFGNIDPVGKPVTIRTPWGKETTYITTGVAENIPQHSRLQFDFLITHGDASTSESWLLPDYSTYVLLRDNTNHEAFAKKLTEGLAKVPHLKSSNRNVVLTLSSLADIQLSNAEYLLAAVGIFVALICWVNYINQVIGQSLWRTRQISVLRILGASQSNLRTQFIVESGLIGTTSLLLVLGFYLAFEQSLQSVTNNHLLSSSNFTFLDFIFLGVFLVGIGLSAAIPNMILSTRNFGATLRNVYTTRVGGVTLRKTLVIVQFSVSTILMISLFVTARQLQYVKDKDKGFKMDDLLIVKTPMVKDTTWYAKRKTLELFKQRCRELPFVIEISSSTTVPGEEYRHETYLSIENAGTKALVHQAGVDEHFLRTFGINFLAGHDFLPDASAQNRNSIILNKSAASALGISDFDKMLNRRIIDHEEPDLEYHLIGIVNDFHQTSLKYEMRPMAFKFNNIRGHFSLKIHRPGSGDSREQQLTTLKKIWDETYAGASFDSFMLDEKYQAQNREDEYLARLFGSSTVLSILISCTGLFGLSLLISTKRQKEIAVRKVFGASPFSILAKFLQEYLSPLTISVIIGSLSAYLLMSTWLMGYAYRIEIGPGIVLLAVVSMMLVFLVTVSYHTIKSAATNPVHILRD